MPSPTITATISCTVRPQGDVHAPGKSQNGFVNFNTNAPCTVKFDNSAVFGLAEKSLGLGNNQLPVQVDSGSTQYCFSDSGSGDGSCGPSGKTRLGNPNQIIVP